MSKHSKDKDHKALVVRVKKAVKKTRRKLSEEQFDKELQRTINFLSELKDHVSHLQAKTLAAKNGKPPAAPPAAKPEKKVAVKVQPATPPVVAAVVAAQAAKPAVKAAAITKTTAKK